MKSVSANCFVVCLLVLFGPSACWASLVALNIGGELSRQEDFVPELPLGTPWSATTILDPSQAKQIGGIADYNAIYRLDLISGGYSLGPEASQFDYMTLVVFNDSAGGGDELDFRFYSETGRYITVALHDRSGQAIAGFSFPDITALTLAAFDLRFARFHYEIEPGRPARQATVDSLSAEHTVSAPSSLLLVLSNLPVLLIPYWFQRVRASG